MPFCVFYFLFLNNNPNGDVLVKDLKWIPPNRRHIQEPKLLCLYWFGSALTRCMLCVSNVLSASASELHSRSDRRRQLHRSVQVLVQKGQRQSVWSASMMVQVLVQKVTLIKRKSMRLTACCHVKKCNLVYREKEHVIYLKQVLVALIIIIKKKKCFTASWHVKKMQLNFFFFKETKMQLNQYSAESFH